MRRLLDRFAPGRRARREAALQRLQAELVDRVRAVEPRVRRARRGGGAVDDEDDNDDVLMPPHARPRQLLLDIVAEVRAGTHGGHVVIRGCAYCMRRHGV